MQTVLTHELRYEIVELIDERIREKHITKENFTELKDIVKEIAKEQKKLATAQKRTESGMKELAVAQKEAQEEIKELAKEQKKAQEEIKELAKEQKKAQEEIKELAKEQKKAQKEIKALALSLKDTRSELKTELKDTKSELKSELKDTRSELKGELKDTRSELKGELKDTKRDLGGITSTLGFMLENEAYRVLPGIVKDKYGIEVKEKFLRRSIRSLGIQEEGEINIFSRGVYKDKGTEVVIIGEAKSRLGKDDIDDLLELSAKLKGIEKGEKFLNPTNS